MATKEQIETWVSLGNDYYFGENGRSVNYKEAAKWWLIAANQGHRKSQYNLGLMYYHGEGVKEDKAEAVKWWLLAAKQGSKSAQYNLGAAYINGEGVKQDYSEGVKWYEKAAEQGHAAAQNNLGTLYENGRGVVRDYEKAAMLYERAALQGHTLAQCNLGELLEKGLGVEKDLQKALSWYEKALQENERARELAFLCREKIKKEEKAAQAQEWYLTGNDYYFGENGKKKNLEEAVKWYRKSAFAGDSLAQFALGEAYENGFGVAEDFFAAVFWYAKAALGENADGDAALEDLKEDCDISALEELAKIDCLADCETAKTAKEFFSLGFNYYNGKGVEKNYEKAVACYLRAAWQGEVGAICNLGLCFENGRGVSKNIELAIYCYEKAANAGNATAQCNLGVLYYYGKKIAKDYKKALYWYKKAEAQGYGRAMYELGVIYGQGVAVKKDLVAAKKYFLKAKEKGYKNAQAGLDWIEKLAAEERRIAQEKEARRKAAEAESKRWAEEKRREEESRRNAEERKRIEQEEKRRKEEEQRKKEETFERFTLNLNYGIGGYYGERLTSSSYSFSAFRGEYKVSVSCSVELSEQYCSGSYRDGVKSAMESYVRDSVRSQMERAGLSGSASIEISISFSVR